MAYSLTNYDRVQRQKLQRRKAEQAQLSMQRQLEQQMQKQAEQEQAMQAQQEQVSGWQRVGETIGDVGANIITGAAKGVEGIIDFGAGIVGAIGGLFDNGFQEDVHKWISNDWVGENIGQPMQNGLKNSYLKDGGIIESVASGLGQMLPSVLVAVGTGGLGASAAVAQAASLGTLGASAAGNSTEQAYNDGASYWGGLGYGLASGAVEVGTEKLFGGGMGKVTGKGLIDKYTKNIATSGIKKVAKNAVEEGIEEVASELVNPMLKGIYKGGDAFDEYATPEYWQGVAQAGVVGGLTSVAYGQTVGRVTGATGKRADITENLQEISELEKTRNDMFANDTLTEQADQDIDNNIRARYQNVSDILTKIKDDKRAKYINKLKLGGIYDPNGQINSEFANKLDGANTDFANADKRYYSPSARQNITKINESLASQGTKVYSGELSNEERQEYAKLKRVHNALMAKGLVGTNLVLAEKSPIYDAYIDGNTIVIGKDVLEKSGAFASKIVHEVEHFTEGSKEWSEFASFIINNTDISKANQAILSADYGVTQEDIDTLSQNLESGQTTDAQKTYIKELVAHQAEYLLSSEESIAKLTNTNKSLARKIYDRIKSFIEVLKAKTPEERQAIRTLQRAEKLFEKALSNAGVDYLREQKQAEKQESIDKKSEVEYSKRYIPYDEEDFEIKNLRTKIEKLCSDMTDCFGNSIAFAIDNTIYVVDFGKDNGKVNFAIRTQSPIADTSKIDILVNEANEEAFRKKYGSDRIFEKLGVESSRKDRGNERGEDKQNHTSNQGKSSNNQRGVYGDSGDRRVYLLEEEPDSVDLLFGNYDKSKQQYSLKIGDSNISGTAEETKNDSRFAKKSKLDTDRRSRNEVVKQLANSSRKKVYSKQEAEEVVNDLLYDNLLDGGEVGVLKGKKYEEVVQALWNNLNTLDDDDQVFVAHKMAEYIVGNAVLEDIDKDEMVEQAISVLNILKSYVRKFDLSNPSLKAEIKAKYGKTQGIMSRWHKKGGIGVDQVVDELAEQGIHIQADNIADILFEINDMYEGAREIIEQKSAKLLADEYSGEELSEFVDAITSDILASYESKGKQSKFDIIQIKHKDEVARLRQMLSDQGERNKIKNRIINLAQKIKNIKNGVMANANTYKTDIFKNSIEQLGKIKNRGNFNQRGTRKIITDLGGWYTEGNEIIGSIFFDKTIKSYFDDIAQGKGAFTVDELKKVENILAYLLHFEQNYNKIYREGKYIDAQEIATRHYNEIKENVSDKTRFWVKVKTLLGRYITFFADPTSVCHIHDRGNRNGYWSTSIDEARQGAVNAAILNKELVMPVETFMKEHKGFEKSLRTRTIKYMGNDLPISVAISLVMTLKREQALAGLAENGFDFENAKGSKVEVKGFSAEPIYDKDLLRQQADNVRASLEKQLNETEKEYIELIEKQFAECKNIKYDTDMHRNGYSNALEGYYYPIRRAGIAITPETAYDNETASVSNVSFNKNTVQGAKSKLLIESVEQVYSRHFGAISIYAKLSDAQDNFYRLLNVNTGDNANNPKTIATISENDWKEGREYIEGIYKSIKNSIHELGKAEKFRMGYAVAVLGANPKVWITQLSSLFAAFSSLSFKSISRGIIMSGKDVDKYCKLAWLRNNDNTVAKASGVMEKVGKVGDFFMKPIGMMDRFVITRLWGACQVEVADKQGLALGSEENKIAAGEMLQEVILDTQQNSIMTERSAAMRSKSEIMKTATMFTADAVKVMSRFIESVCDIIYLKEKRKSLSGVELENANKQIKESKKRLVKALTSVVTSALFMALVAQLFNKLLKKKEEENPTEAFVADFIGNMIGGLPIIKDFYAKLVQGYDLDNYNYSTMNNVLDSVGDMLKLTSNAMTGELDSKEVAKSVRDLFFSSGQLLGLPFKNVHNIANAAIQWIDPEAGYAYENMYKTSNFKADLKKAVEKGDERKVNAILEVMMNENLASASDSIVQEVKGLYLKDYNVLPKNVPNSIAINGEDTALKSKDKQTFKQIYSNASKTLARVFANAQYKSLSDDSKASVARFVYDSYYALAVDTLGGVATKQSMYAQAVDISQLALALAYRKELLADKSIKDKKAAMQKYVESLSLSAVQKYMVMGYMGYKNKHGKQAVQAYISSLGLTKEESDMLLHYSGY